MEIVSRDTVKLSNTFYHFDISKQLKARGHCSQGRSKQLLTRTASASTLAQIGWGGINPRLSFPQQTKQD